MKHIYLLVALMTFIGCSPAQENRNGDGNDGLGEMSETPTFTYEELTSEQLAERGLKAEDFYVDYSAPEGWHANLAEGLTLSSDNLVVLRNGVKGKFHNLTTVAQVTANKVTANQSTNFRLSDGVSGTMTSKVECTLAPQDNDKKGNKKVSCETVENSPIPPGYDPTKYINQSCYIQNGNIINQDQKFALVELGGKQVKALIFRIREGGLIKCGNEELGQGEEVGFYVVAKEIPDSYSFSNRNSGVLFFHVNTKFNGESVTIARSQAN